MSDSVGKISLDIDISDDLSKEISKASEKIGKNMSNSIESRLGATMKRTKGMMSSIGKQVLDSMQSSLGKMKNMATSFKVPKSSLEVPKQEFNMQPFFNESDRTNKALQNVNEQIDIQRQKLEQLKQEYNSGLSENTKHEIEQQNQVMIAAEHRIESLRIKLKDLQFSYENAINPERKNKLLEEISKTSSQMTTLISRSDNASHKIRQLEDGLSGEKRNALRERIVKTESSLLNLGNRAQKIQKDMQGADKSFRRVRSSATKTEKPVRRLGSAFFGTGKRANVMGGQFVAAFQRIAKQVLVFAVLYKAIRGFQNYISSTLRTNDQFMHSLNQVRTNLQVAFMPIYQAILPALQAFMNWLAKATAYIAAFISAIFGKTYQQSYQAAQGINSAKNAMDGFGGSAKKAGKEAQKQLAGFDEINTIGDSSDGSDSGGAGGGGAGGIAPLTPPDMDIAGVQAKMNKLVAGIKNVFSGAWDSIRSGWTWTVETFGPAFQKAWGNIAPELEKWKETFRGVFADIVSLGDPLANWFNDHLIPGWENAIESYSIIIGGLLDVSRQVFDSVWEAVFPIIEKFITKGLPVFTDFLSSVIDIFTDLFLLSKGIFDDIWQDVVDPVMQLISQIIQDGLDMIFEWWNTWGVKIVDGIRTALGKIKELWDNLWQNFLQPFISNMLEMLTDLWDNHLKGLISEVGNFVGKLVNSALEIFNKFIMPIANWLTKTLGPVFQVIFSAIGGFVTSAIGGIADTISGLIKILGGLIDFITGVFTGNWRRAWLGLADIFRGIANTLVAIIKAPLNGIIGAVNGAIRGLNKVKVPSWVPGLGGKGINITQIPKLAQGGIVDQPTIAMVGEDGGEAVMPLERNTGWISNLAGQISNQMGGSSVGNDELVNLLKKNNEILTQLLDAIISNSESEIVMKLQETEFGRVIIRAINNLQRQSGKTLIEV